MLTLVLSAAPAAPRLKDTVPSAEVLVGRWAAVQVVSNGKDNSELNRTLEYEFTADGAWNSRRDGKASWENGVAGYTADPAVRPAALTLLNNRTDPDCHRTQAIYKVEGDRLVIAWGDQARDRPGGFDTSPDVTVIVFTRVKDR
jgi:uncharacterized protein (TIGR03067 family)